MIINALCYAFSKYSIVSRQVKTAEQTDIMRRYSLCFLPLVGALEGTLYCLILYALMTAEAPEMIRGAVLTVYTLFYTGGIHMKGFMAVCNTMKTGKDHVKRNAALKEEQTKTSAVIMFGAWLVLYFAASCGIKSTDQIMIVAMSFVLSRTFMGLEMSFFRNANESGLAFGFSSTMEKGLSRLILILFAVVTCLAMWYINPFISLAATEAAFVIMICSRIYSYESFGGFNESLAGYFLQIRELAMLIIIAMLGTGVYV